ncbi:hypothetical protein NKR23_g3403 [Pleurostoma richardsiae]|uniref:Uncharacterized protein n=1 Tax=Pleurostoma richardsiae TaxID=41990 RepID=A0AA38VTP0_9PEZI|nr:hypothetical protein NKR23_g3403 [Pleurostoma richardsiae]
MRLPSHRRARPVVDLDWLRVRDHVDALHGDIHDEDDLDDDDDDDDDAPSPAAIPPPAPSASLTTSSIAISTTTAFAATSSTLSTGSDSATSTEVFTSTSTFLTSTSTPETTTTSVFSSTSSISLASSRASSVQTRAPSSSSTAVATAETQTKQAHHHDDGNDLPGGVKVGIAFGVIAAGILLVSLIWAFILYRRRRRRLTQGDRLADGPPTRQRPFLLPFVSRNRQPPPPTPRSHGRSRSAVANSLFAAAYRAHAAPPGSDPHPGRRVPTFGIGSYAAAAAAARATDDPMSGITPQGYLDEKRPGPGYPIPIMEPTPVPQARLRGSIASWFRRASAHHPLRLNPPGGSGGIGSRPGTAGGRSVRTSTASSYWSRSEYEARAAGGEDGEGGGVPPVPAVPRGVDSFTRVPREVFTREQARAYYRSVWSESTPSEGGMESRRGTLSD